MAKPTPTKEEQGFVYQLGQDVAKLGFEIEKLKSKSVKAIRIIVPAKPDRYKQYSLRTVISLPEDESNCASQTRKLRRWRFNRQGIVTGRVSAHDLY